MIYLLSQMLLALALAVVLGMALGWVIHRTTSNRMTHQLKQTIAQQNAHLAQVQSEVSMLTDDYEELHRQSQDQLNTLQSENQQIPSLSSNLEKSQLLVRQMMQRHETEIRELNKVKQQLTTKLAKLDSQVQARNQVVSGLEKRRSRRTQIDATSKALATPVAPNDTPSNADTELTTLTTTAEKREFKASKPAVISTAESESDPFDQVMEVADDMQRELDMTAERNPPAIEIEAVADVSETELLHTDSDERESLASISTSAIKLDTHALHNLPRDSEAVNDLDNLIVLDDIGDSTYDNGSDTLNQTDELDELNDLNDLNDLDELNDLAGLNELEELNENELIHADGTLDETSKNADNDDIQLDGSSDHSALFRPVSQHDDLQQIFGIGPLTEKALNELGITSYSQLAELKQHEIQHIADALEIGPGRIERDNWVGNARRQLEDVLEQL